MKRTTLVVAIACLGGIANAQTFFYGGDPDFVDGLISGQNLVSGGEAETYDDFNVGATTTVSSIYGNFFAASEYTAGSFNQAYYEIRSGMSDGNGGTLLYSGTVTASATDTGTNAFGLEIYDITAQTNFNLGAGTYWVTLAPVGDGTGSIYVATTSGANSIGSPILDGDSFFNAISVYTDASGHPFEDTSNELGFTGDFSYGLTAAATPEPASMAVLGLGVLGLIRRRRASK